MASIGSERPLPLQGLIVIDLTRLLPGPLCTMMLGDYGADVIKVEDIDAGDPTRFVGTAFKGSGSFFRQLNRNKRSIALNLKTDSGREILKKLAARADVLVEGFRPGVMDRLGLSYKELSSINPGLVYAALSGYGQEGPYREKAGHDINYTALTGLLDLSAQKDGSPVMPAVQIADIAGGSMMALSGIMFALYERQRTEMGRFVDIAMTKGLLPWMVYAASYLDGGKEEMPRCGSGHITGAYACYNIYETADGKQMSLGALEPVFWKRFCEAIGSPQWIPLQFDQESRIDLINKVRKVFKEKTRQQWEEYFKSVDACCEPVLDLNEAINHPISIEGKYWIESPIDEGKTEKITGFPLLFSGQSGRLRLSPPGHGENTEDILKELGYRSTSIKEFEKTGIIKIKNIN